jgi:hypothetical protein
MIPCSKRTVKNTPNRYKMHIKTIRYLQILVNMLEYRKCRNGNALNHERKIEDAKEYGRG